jgi:hypothetical protein
VGGAKVSMDISVDDFLMGGFPMFDAHTGRGLVGEFFLRDYGVGSDAGQLAVVLAPVAAGSVVVAKGSAQDPWAKFCASGEIASAAAAKDVAGLVA